MLCAHEQPGRVFKHGIEFFVVDSAATAASIFGFVFGKFKSGGVGALVSDEFSDLVHFRGVYKSALQPDNVVAENSMSPRPMS